MNFKNLAMWAIIVFLTIGLYNMFKNPQSNLRGNNQIIFSDFLTSVDNGEVLKVDIQGNNIKGVYSNGNSFSTYAPNDPNLIEKLSDKGVSISAAPLEEDRQAHTTSRRPRCQSDTRPNATAVRLRSCLGGTRLVHTR